MKVTEIMSHPVISAPPELPVKEAARMLVERGISAMPVIDSRGTLVGIVSEADLVPIETRPDPRSQATPVRTPAHVPRTVSEVMTRKVITVRADAEISKAARTMLDAGIKRVPVVDGRNVVGVVSRRDLMRVIARNDEFVRAEVASRLEEVGIMPARPLRVAEGVVTIDLAEVGPSRRLAESLALSVPSVLEVRFEPGA
jgi:CBS domain-containing protein